MKTFYVLWNPASHMPPKVRFDTFHTAKVAAEQMATRHPGETFHVLENRGAVVKADLHWELVGEPAPF